MKIKLQVYFLLLLQFSSFTLAISQSSGSKQTESSSSPTTGIHLKTAATQLGVYNWFENKASATVLTLDDFSPGQPAIGIPYLISRNLTATFFVTTGNAWRWNDYDVMKNAVSNGIEIANHTLTHPNLQDLSQSDPTQMKKEINATYDTLNKYVTNQKVFTFTYPFGAFNDDVISVVRQRHIAARTVYAPGMEGWTYNFATTNNDYYTIKTQAVNQNLSKDNFAMTIEDGITDGGLVTFMIHSINSNDYPDTWFDAISSDFYGQLLDTLKHYSDQTWITTFSNAVRYHKEANSSTLQIESNDINETVLSLTDTLSNNSIFNQALSIYFKPTAKSFYTSIKQNGIDLAFQQNNGLVTFNAIPDGGTIILTKDPAQSEDPALSISDMEAGLFKATLYPVPSNGNSVLELNLNSNDVYSFKVTDMQGKVITKSSSIHYGGSSLVNESISVQNKGIYFVEVTINNQIKTLKMVVE